MVGFSGRLFELYNYVHIGARIARFQVFGEFAASREQAARQECGEKENRCL